MYRKQVFSKKIGCWGLPANRNNSQIINFWQTVLNYGFPVLPNVFVPIAQSCKLRVILAGFLALIAISNWFHCCICIVIKIDILLVWLPIHNLLVVRRPFRIYLIVGDLRVCGDGGALSTSGVAGKEVGIFCAVWLCWIDGIRYNQLTSFTDLSHKSDTFRSCPYWSWKCALRHAVLLHLSDSGYQHCCKSYLSKRTAGAVFSSQFC